LDTIDLKVLTNKEILEEDLEQLRELKMINGFKYGVHGKVFIVSFPRYFYYRSNAYLITKESEVQEVLKELKGSIKALGYQVEKEEILRGDYPFTHNRPGLETFKGWGQIWRFLGLCAEVQGWKYKEIGQDGEIETLIIQDTFRNKASKERIKIYNQALKLEVNGELELSLKEFPCLDTRSRIEVSQRIRREVKSFKRKILKEIKKTSYDLLEEIVFKSIPAAKERAIKELENLLKEWREEKGSTFRLSTFIEANKFKIYDFTILREAIKRIYPGGSYRTVSKRAKKCIEEMEKRDGVYYQGNLKRIEQLRKEIKKESKISTVRSLDS